MTPGEYPTGNLRRAVRAISRRKPAAPKSVRVNGVRYDATDIDDFTMELAVGHEELLSIIIESTSTAEERGSALVEIRAKAASGARLAIPGWQFCSNRVDEYIYLEPTEPGRIAQTRIDIRTPPHATRLELVGHRWKSAVGTSVVGSPLVNRSSQPQWQFETPTGAKLDFRADVFDQTIAIPEVTRSLELSIDHVAVSSASKGPVSVSALDVDGKELLPLGDLPQHPHYGSILQLFGDVGERKTSLVEFTVPEEAKYLRIQGVEWGSSTAHISGNVELRPVGTHEFSVEDFIQNIPVDDRLIVIDTTAPPMGHATLGLRPNNLAHAYARQGNWVVFLPFSSLQGFDPSVNEKLYQVPRADVGRLWAAVREHRRNRHDIFICSSFPSFESNAVAEDMKRLGWTCVYEVRDDMEEFNRVGYSRWYTPVLEQNMLRIADRVVSVSTALDQKMVSMRPGLKQHTVIPNAVRQEVILDNADQRGPEIMSARESLQTIGYVGHLTSSWFDWDLLLEAAKQLPDVQFEIVGHGKPADIELPANVAYLGPKSHEELKTVTPTWKAGIIPFMDIPLTRSVDPNKIYEYFAWGLPCVTIQMGAVETYPWTWVYDGVDSFIEQIQAVLDFKPTAEDMSTLESFAKTMTWDDRASSMLEFIQNGAAS